MRGGPADRLVPEAVARRVLRLTAEEFELAVELGHVRVGAVPVTGGAWGSRGERVMTRAELDRAAAELHRAGAGRETAEGPRDRLRLVGTIDGAAALGISRDRFTRLARAGLFRPARWYLNRYHAVVWLYSEAEVIAFGDGHPGWMTGRLPEGTRRSLEEGTDLRARGWRARRSALLSAQAPDSWHEAAVWWALLGPGEAADLLGGGRERSRLTALRPSLLTGPPDGQAAGDSPVRLVADDPEEIASARACLAQALRRARDVDTSRRSCCRTVTGCRQRGPYLRSLFTRVVRAGPAGACGASGSRHTRSLPRPARPDSRREDHDQP